MKKYQKNKCRGCPLMKANHLMARTIHAMVMFDIRDDTDTDTADDMVSGIQPLVIQAGMKKRELPHDILRHYQ